METIENPLRGAPPKEVPLPAAPLVRVIAQLRFPAELSVEQPSSIAPFQEAIRDDFPVLRQDERRVVVASAGPGPVQFSTRPAWRFSNVEGATRVSLTSDFLALETTSYSSRDSFLKQLRSVTTALNQHVRPRFLDRLGLRYIDRVVGKALANLPSLVRQEIVGVMGEPLSHQIVHSLCESVLEAPEEDARILARWGRLPAKGTADPSALEPIDEASFILDLDMFRQESRPFDVDDVLKEARSYSERIYTFFRWAVTEEFLKVYGGRP